MTDTNLNELGARTIDNVLKIVDKAQVTFVLGELSVFNQELSTLQAISRQLKDGTLTLTATEEGGESVTTDGNTDILDED